MSESILSNVKRCYFCDSPERLHRHHCFGGTANRRLSEEDGCWVWLCADHHTLSSLSVHQNRKMDLVLKIACQSRWEDLNGGREAFLARYGKSWILEDGHEIQS